MTVFKQAKKNHSLPRVLLLLLLAGWLLTLAGCGNGENEKKEGNDVPSLVDSAVFDGSWVPLSENAAQNAIEIKDGKVTWYVLRTDGSGFLSMEEYRKKLLAENDALESAEFTAELIGDRLTMVLTVTGSDGNRRQEPVSGTLSLSGDTLTLSLSGGMAGGSAGTVEFKRSTVPVADYRADTVSPG